MGFLKRLFGRSEAKPAPAPAAAPKAAPKPVEKAAAKPKPAAKSTAKPAAKAPAKKAAKPAAKSDKAYRPQCAALTKAGDQCKSSAREGSKYCASHKGYRPPAKAAAKGAKDTVPKVKGAEDTAPATRKAAPKKEKAPRPQCGGISKAGDQCKNSAREGSKYCASHKGYRPPAKDVAAKAKDTKPAAKKAADTKPAARKTPAKKAPAKKAPAKKPAAKSAQVRHEDYRLYKAGNRYYFSKKSPGELAGSAQAVKEMPADREIVVTSTGLPVLKKK